MMMMMMMMMMMNNDDLFMRRAFPLLLFLRMVLVKAVGPLFIPRQFRFSSVAFYRRTSRATSS